MKRTIFFDLEGTLVTLDRQHYIVDRVLKKRGIYLNITAVYKIRGFGNYNVSKEFFKGLVAFHRFKLNENLLSKENLEKILDNYVKKLSLQDLNLAKEIREEYKKLRYKTLIKIKEKLYPGVKKTLNALSNRYLLGIYTARKKQSTLHLLKTLGIDKFFNTVITGEVKRKRGSDAFIKSCNSLEITCNESYIVGDSELDIIDGRKAGLKTILVLTGNGSIALQKKTEPDYVIRGVYEILKLLKYD